MVQLCKAQNCRVQMALGPADASQPHALLSGCCSSASLCQWKGSCAGQEWSRREEGLGERWGADEGQLGAVMCRILPIP